LHCYLRHAQSLHKMLGLRPHIGVKSLEAQWLAYGLWVFFF